MYRGTFFLERTFTFHQKVNHILVHVYGPACTPGSLRTELEVSRRGDATEWWGETIAALWLEQLRWESRPPSGQVLKNILVLVIEKSAFRVHLCITSYVCMCYRYVLTSTLTSLRLCSSGRTRSCNRKYVSLLADDHVGQEGYIHGPVETDKR